MNACEELDVLHIHLVQGNAKLVLELPPRRVLGTLLAVQFGTHRQRVGAAGVRPHIRERNFLWSAALKEQLARRRIKEEHGKRAMQEALANVGHQVALLLAAVAHKIVVVIHNDAALLHEADLLLIVSLKRDVLRCRTVHDRNP